MFPERHNGVDFRAPIGTPVACGASGIVLAINYGSVPYCQYGQWVLIKHPNGLATLYAHLSDINVTEGNYCLHRASHWILWQHLAMQ